MLFLAVSSQLVKKLIMMASTMGLYTPLTISHAITADHTLAFSVATRYGKPRPVTGLYHPDFLAGKYTIMFGNS